jgi:hypothetical protein
MTSLGGGGGSAGVIVAGALTTAVGLVVAATAPIFGTAPLDRIQHQQASGGLVVLVGWAVLAWGIHRFGRS